MSKIGDFFKKLFGVKKKPVPNPSPLPQIPVSDGENDLGTLPPINPHPTCGGRVLDTINDGNPRNPDHTYLYDNLVFDADKVDWIKREAGKIFKNLSRYQKVSARTGVPAWFIGLIHYRESSLSFNTVLHNGETLANVNRYGTRLVPKNRGKGKNWTWEDAAVDALIYEYGGATDWSLKKALPRLEQMNGLGYRKRIGDHGVVEYSPYIVAGSKFHDETSKFKYDGVYDAHAPEKQLGVFTLAKSLELDYGVCIS